MDEELYILIYEGYNPITKTNNGPEIEIDYDINPDSLICDTINSTYKNLEVMKNTKMDIKGIKGIKKYFINFCNQL